MKGFFKAVAISAIFLSPLCQANANSLGKNKDCENTPVSEYGMSFVTAHNEYKSNPKKFTKAFTSFCNKGKTMGDMGYDAAWDFSVDESSKWVKNNLPDKSNDNGEFSTTIAHLLHDAMLSGFTGLDLPEPPKEKEAYTEADKSTDEACGTIVSTAAKSAASRVPPNVTITLSEWAQLKSEYGLICFTGFMQGQSQTQIDAKLADSLDDISQNVYVQAYKAGARHPKPAATESVKESPKQDVKGVDGLLGEPSNNGVAQKKANEKRAAAGDNTISSTDKRKKLELGWYISGIQQAVQSQLSDYDSYKGKKSTVSIDIEPSGKLIKSSCTGDSDLCAYAIRAVNYTKFPQKPNSMEPGAFHTMLTFNP